MVGWNPGPPARPCTAGVGPSIRGAALGVSGEDQDPSGSRRGEGTAPGGSARAGNSLSLSGALAGGDCAECRNHPAGGATPGQEVSSAADSSAACGVTACLAPAGSGPGLDSSASACGWRGLGTISP